MYSGFNCNNVEEDVLREKCKDIELTFDTDVTLNDKVIVCICDLKYQNNIFLHENDNILINIVRKLWKQAEASIGSTNFSKIDIIETRTQITNFFLLCRYSMLSCRGKSVENKAAETLSRYMYVFRRAILTLSDLDLETRLTSLPIHTDNTNVYHFFHMHLDVQWLLLNLEYLCKPGSDVEKYIEGIFADLIFLSEKVYSKVSACEIVTVSPFICPCVKHMWLIIQLFIEKLNKNFWIIFNSLVNSSDEVFVLWLLKHLVMETKTRDLIHCSQLPENHLLVSTKLQQLLSTNSSISSTLKEDRVLNTLKLVEPMVTNQWIESSRPELYQFLWEYFNKNLNNSFNAASPPKSVIQLIELIHGVDSNSISSYALFVFLLRKHLQMHPEQWPKLRGRIYSRLPPHKINELNETGLYHISLLFLSLAGAIDHQEVCTKLLSLLENLTGERKSSPLVWIVNTVTIILYLEKELDIREVSLQMQHLVQDASEKRELYHLIRLHVDGLDYISNMNVSFRLQQQVLLGSWVSKFMTGCSSSDLCFFLDVLSNLLKRVYSTGDWVIWSPVFEVHILRSLKQIAISTSAPVQVGHLAAIISQCNISLLSDSITYFCSDQIVYKVCSQYICTLLEEYPGNYNLKTAHEATVIQAWIRCCLLNTENTEDLTKKVLNLNRMVYLNGYTDVSNINSLCSFIESLNHNSTGRLKELCETCFGLVDRWIGNVLSTPPSESLILHIYTCFSLLFFHCAQLLYHKNKSMCVLSRLVNVLLLPTDILIGKMPNIYILRAVHRTWHLFVQGIASLDYSSDPYLERTLRDLVVRYVPLLPVADSPMLKCLNNTQIATFILEKISSSFLAHSSKSSDENALKALRIVLAAVENTHCVDTLSLVVQKMLPSVLELLMFRSAKSVAVDVIKSLVCSELYSQVRKDVRKCIVMVTEKHLAFSANYYFQLATTLIKLIPIDIQSVIPDIKKHIVIVERMRGVGFDNTLRQGLDRIEAALLV